MQAKLPAGTLAQVGHGQPHQAGAGRVPMHQLSRRGIDPKGEDEVNDEANESIAPPPGFYTLCFLVA